MASWSFITVLAHSPQGYFDLLSVVFGPGFGDASPQTSSFLSIWKMLVPLVVYWTLATKKRFARDRQALLLVQSARNFSW